VQRYLDRRRPLATEVHVVGPEYIAVEVSAALHVPAGSRVGVVEAANAALNHFLSPLEGGPRGDGWPFGRDVIEGELLAVLQGVPGVSFVDGVSIRIATGSPRCGHAMLCGTQLVDAARHDLVVKEDGQ